MDPPTGGENEFFLGWIPGAGQVFATWQWYRFARGQMSGAKKIVTINLDETAICSFLAAPGYMLTSRSATGEEATGPPASHASLARRRAYMSHIALVCDSPEHQHMLPQVLMVTKKLLTVAAATEIKDRCPPNVYLKHGDSAWNNADLMVELIVLLALIFAPLRDTIDLVLTFDACRVHLARKVFACARFHGIGISTIAANMTWLLQTLDTMVFSTEKLLLKHAYARCAMEHGSSAVPIKTWVLALMTTIGAFFRTINCAAHFRGNGFTPDQAAVRAKILSVLALDTLPPIPSVAPSALQLQDVLPSDVPPHPDMVYKPLHQALSREAVAAGTLFFEHFNSQASAIVADPLVSHSWAPRARLHHKSSLAQVAASPTAAPSSSGAASSAAAAAPPPVPPL